MALLGLTWTGQNGTFVFMSTGDLAQPDVSPCILYQSANLVDPDLHEVVVAVLLQVPPQVSRAALKDLSDVVHLDVEDLDVDLVERDGPQDLNQRMKMKCIFLCNRLRET